MDFDRFLEKLKSERALLDISDLQELLTHRELFDKDHETTVLQGKLPSNINDIAYVIDCFFSEGIDDWLTILEWKKNKSKKKRK